ncbi:bifunctional lysylphosphatidylglycerol flippase/synthetase MprF [Cohnella silvisoli]|uniref:Phosphatidylglycerol lysyltransferase n=1 Tax=Cohnella silvisoli TaxID=2873699 RepID=A0ABV1KST7_9BACL|nr:bifunctional lysylphosphatidylglycerol flippase/synthetase MprF [Cohnella silvisoli]MCD9021401.1 bifunctional lysylphosphatidylglycerol flippase/synthetase MprF [Cohnella silvisoli]
MNDFAARIFERGKKNVKFVLPVLILLFLFWQTHQFLQEIKPGIALHIMGRLKFRDHLLLLAVSLCAVAVMTAYDFLLLRWNQMKLPLLTLWKISWIANTFNNAMGFAGFTGAGLRLMMYRKRGLQTAGLLKSVLYLTLSMMTGLSFLGILLLAGVWSDHGMLKNHLWMTIVAIAFSVYIVVFLLLPRMPKLKNAIGLESETDSRWTVAVGTVFTSIIEWLAASFTFWVVVHTLHIHLDFRETTGIFVIAAMAGIASFVPGGLGSFDVIALLGMQYFDVMPGRAFAAILLFRVFYYFIPWTIGLVLATSEWMPNREVRDTATQQILKPAVKRWHAFWHWPDQAVILRDIGNWALSALVFISGLLLLLSAATPGEWHRMQLLEQYVTPVTMRFSHQVTVLVGLLMLIVSEGIWLQVKRAYYATLVLLIAGSIFSLLKGFDYEETLFFGIVFLLLWISKSRFHRQQAVYPLRKMMLWTAVMLLVTVLYLSVSNLTNNGPKWWFPAKLQDRYLLRDQELVREALFALLASWMGLTARWLLRPQLPSSPLPESRQFAKLQHFLQTNSGNYLTHLHFLGDKSFFWTTDEKAMLAYGQIGKSLIALGDPIGDPASIRLAVRQFREFADQHAAVAAFYQVKAEFLPMYHEFGFRFFKLGEEAVVMLDQFHMSGRRKADLRAVSNRYERKGYVFEIVLPPFTPLLMMEMKEVSDEWLKERNEKSFSLGAFQEIYLELAPVALLRDREGRLTAFASLMPTYEGKKSISIDLMRYRMGLPNGIMDMMFVHLLQWAKSEGYERFNLGMAPLSSVGESVYSHRGERMARWIFLKGDHFYRFQGIRQFKEKFDPVWEQRYLAYPKNASFSKLAFQVTRLIARRISSLKR